MVVALVEAPHYWFPRLWKKPEMAAQPRKPTKEAGPPVATNPAQKKPEPKAYRVEKMRAFCGVSPMIRRPPV